MQTSYILKRLGYGLLLMLGVVVLNFLLIRLAPGDPAVVIAGEMGGATEEMLETRAQTLVQELETRCRMIVAGVRAIQNDENPRIVDQRLESFYRPPGA